MGCLGLRVGCCGVGCCGAWAGVVRVGALGGVDGIVGVAVCAVLLLGAGLFRVHGGPFRGGGGNENHSLFSLIVSVVVLLRLASIGQGVSESCEVYPIGVY